MRRVLLADRLATASLWAVAVLVIGLLLAIILHFILASLPTFSIGFLFSDPSDTEIGGIGPLLFNSLYISADTAAQPSTDQQ